MEITSKFKERELLHQHHQHHSSSPLNSPNNTHNHNNNTLPITRSDPNSPYPTTFVTADTSSFKQVVQMLTGSSETTPTNKTIPKQHNTTTPTNPATTTAEAACSQQRCEQAASSAVVASKNYIIPPIKTTQPKKQGFKLFERRNSIKHLISPLNATSSSLQTTSFSPRHNNNKQDAVLSPSLLDFPSLTLLSPVTPLVEDPFDKSSPSVSCSGPTTAAAAATSSSSEEVENKAIAEKGFYLHPSPNTTPRDSQPQLLPLFPLSSPRASEA